MRRLLLRSLTSLLLMGCAAAPQPQTPGAALGQPFEVPLGQTTTVSETGLAVAFHQVVEDSRCPRTVQCVWAGRAKVELELTAPGEAASVVSLATCCAPNEPREITYAGQTINLQGLMPAPERPGDAIADYRAQLLVTTS